MLSANDPARPRPIVASKGHKCLASRNRIRGRAGDMDERPFHPAIPLGLAQNAAQGQCFVASTIIKELT